MEKIFIDGLYYQVNDENLTAELVYSWESDYNFKEINIPAQIVYKQKTYKVTSIGYSAFSKCRSLISITIPDSVNKIESGALWSVPSLKSIIVDPGNLTYDSRDNCQAIIDTSSNKLIAGCQKTIIPDSVTSIGPSAFRGCNSLTSITIPDSVTAIELGAFTGCSALTSLTIPDSVNKIESGALWHVPSLKSIIVDPGNPTYDSRDNCQAIIDTSSNKLIAGCQKTIIPDSVTSIGSCAFLGCNSLTSINIPDSVTEIGSSAFRECNSLTSITIPDGVTEMGNFAFSNCSALTSITIPESVTEIGWDAFSGNDALTAIDYHGTKEQWQQIKKHEEWKDSPNIQVVRCRDGVWRL